MFKLIISDDHKHKAYTQSPQRNPLLWMITHRTKDTLTSQAGWMRCKDFFNDLVAGIRNVHFGVYGFDNNTIKYNKFGSYVLLKNVAEPDRFIANIQNGINTKMKEDLGTHIRAWKQGTDEVVIRLPLKILDNTYAMSLATMLIRCCNYATDYASFEDFFNSATSPIKLQQENAMTDDAKKLALKCGFKAPIENEWYYSSGNYKASTLTEDQYQMLSSAIHNNGISDWARAIRYNNVQGVF